MEDIDKSNTVKVVNVGGKHYEFSPSLVERIPESMLAALLSDTWRKSADPSKPIFIDRDGEIFAHVLNYLRYGSIVLPVNVPREMYERELDYYGIPTDDSCIQSLSSVGTMKIIKQTIRDAELHHDMLLIAATCYSKFMSGRTTVQVRSGDIDLRHNPYYYDQGTAMDVLNGYLSKFYGLRASYQQALFASDYDFVLKVKEASDVDVVGDSQESTPKRSRDQTGIEDSNSISSSISTATPKAWPLEGPRGHILNDNEFLRALNSALMTP